MASISSEYRIDIKAEPSAVFRYLSQLNLHYIWNPGLRQLKPEGPLKQGMKYEAEVVLFGNMKIKTENMVTSYRENKEIKLENQLGLIKYVQTYQLQTSGKGTQLISLTDILTPSQVFGLTLPVLKQLAQQELKADLNLLKIAVENNLKN